MALTVEEKKYWEEVLEKTSGDRKSMFSSRKVPEDYRAFMNKVTVEEIMLDVPNVKVPVKCRIYMPLQRREKCIVYVYAHGGGFYYPWTEDDALYCSEIACRIQGIVVDVDYALTDQHPFPVATEQVYEALRWAYGKCKEWNADASKIVVGGCSAGGCMAAGASILAQQRKEFPIALQILDCAALDNATSPEYKPEADLLMMPLERMKAFSMLYSDGDKEIAYDSVASPAFVEDTVMAELPDALIITAGRCSLRFEDELYGRRLAALGVEVTMKQFRDSDHAFTIRMKDQWREAHDLIVWRLQMLNLQEGA